MVIVQVQGLGGMHPGGVLVTETWRSAKILEGEVASSVVSKTRLVRMLRLIKKGTVGKQMGKSG